MPKVQGSAAILLAALLWSSGGLFIKWIPLPALAVAGGRASVTALFYLLVLRPKLRQARLSTAFAYAAMILTFVAANKATTAASAVLLQYTGTAWVLIAGYRFFGERVTRIDVLAVIGCLGGMALCLLDDAKGITWQGNALGAISGVFFAMAVILMRRDAQVSSDSAQASITIGNLIGAIVGLSLGGSDLVHGINGQAVVGLLWLGLMQMGAAYLLFLRGLRTVTASTASLLSLLEPAVSPMWVWLGTGERPGAATLAGGVLMLGSLAARALVQRSAP
jgi:drug/metabolite transporter (DMT)-like permease